MLTLRVAGSTINYGATAGPADGCLRVVADGVLLSIVKVAFVDQTGGDGVDTGDRLEPITLSAGVSTLELSAEELRGLKPERLSDSLPEVRALLLRSIGVSPEHRAQVDDTPEATDDGL